jgi:hypothetical protein
MDSPTVLRALVERWNVLAKEQKISAGILAVCGLIAMVLSVERLNASVRDPFTVSRDTLESARRALDKIDPSKRLEDESKRRDTDGDGLSDYDEEHRFQTSPYLRDTDGDRSPDNVELALGTNPNCADGQGCATGLIDISGLATSTPYLLPAAVGTGDAFYAAFQRGVNASKAATVTETGSTSTELEQGLVRDAAEIRAVLKASGQVDQALIDQLTDAQLLELYDKAVAENAKKTVEAETGITDPNKYPVPDVDSLDN